MSGSMYDKIINDFDKANETPIDDLTKLKRENELLKKSRSEIIQCSAEWQSKWEKAQAEVDSLKVQLKDKDHTIKVFTERYNNDCIEINRLNTTIDVLIHKIEYLRQFAGLE